MLIYRLSYLKAGLDPQTSQEIAEKVTQSPDRVLEDVIDIMNNEDIETPSKEQIEELKNDYFEAISSYGEIAEDVLVANEELKNLIQTRGGKSEDEAKEIAHKYGLMVAKDFQIAKDNGYEGSFNEFKNEHYKLNGITDFSNDTAPVNENIKETSIEEQEDIWKEVEREKAVQLQEGIDRYMEESQPAKLYSFGGENAEGGKVLNNLNTAKALFEEGVDNEEIRQQTGWFKGVDNKWRFEINDEKAEFNKGYNPDEWKKNGVVFNGLNFSLGKILKHDELYEVYPWLRHITVQYTSRMDELGGLDNGYRTIYLNSKQNADELKSVLMHEIQHLIQRREDFARGGSPYEFASKEYLDKEVDRTKSRLDKAKEALAVADDLGYDDSALYDGFTILEYKTNLPLYESSYNEAVKDRENYVAEPFEAYQRLGGETEARNVQSRLKLTDEERRNTPIEETQDIKNEDLIIKFSSGREFAYNAGVTKKTIQKAREVKSALQKIANGSEEETVVNLRDDLEQFGGTNDVTFIYGNDKKGIYHIAEVHGIKTLLRVFDTVIDGSVARFVKNKKTVILEKNGIEAVLSLDENGNKKTWLLTGWNTKISPDEEREFRATLKSTQEEPTFSRQILGAELSNLNITPSDEDVNTKLYSREEGSERPYSNRQLDRMLDNAEENKEALIDLYY
ncbi:MAG: hypothetical protein IKW39_05185, partial [Alphaproteobacteria bacterium]|nr:hypothetical protein [Alphaproteobacteria bacterium]